MVVANYLYTYSPGNAIYLTGICNCGIENLYFVILGVALTLDCISRYIAFLGEDVYSINTSQYSC